MNNGIEINNYNYALNEEFAYLDELQKEVEKKKAVDSNSTAKENNIQSSEEKKPDENLPDGPLKK